ncbi:MAG TPA: DUF6288 domain-containing protein [Methylomirabilota bacterium]|nr:DUF6288 domain-containing protein [Methylomirabilota bacterium]
MNFTSGLIQTGSRSALLSLLCAACFGLASAALGASGGKTPTIPDFTKGDVIPADAKHDWNLGPTGARGWMFCDKMVTSDARQVKITAVDKGSPAEGVLAVGDVLLGVGGKAFSFDPRTELGRAITAAESEAGGGKLALTRWRSGRTNEVVVTLPVMGSFSATAPYDCPKSKRIFEQGIKALATRVAAPDYAKKTDSIPRSLNALALLASGDAEHLPLLKREAQWAADFKTGSFRTWYYGYVMIFLAEYVTATGDQSVLPGLRRLALEAANGQSAVGSWGHTFALPDGRLRGYGMMNSPGLPLTIGLVLARDAGVKDPEIARAIELSARLLRFYIGKGSVPYGDHAPWMEGHEDNGKCGMAAVLFNLLGEANGADFFTRMATAAHGNERDQGHTGNFFNMLWSLPAIAQAGPQATGAWMKEFGTAYHDLARRWDGTWPHQGPPEPDFDSYKGWDATGAYLLGYALPLKKITLTGRKPGIVEPFTAETAQNIIADGRGWTNKDRTGFYVALGETELLKRLGSWSPIVRERAAAALAKLKARPVQAVIALLDSPRLEARLGACSALEAFGGQAAPAVPKLRATLQHPDLWLRVKAGEALAAIGKPALPALPEMLERVNAGPDENDPRGMEQRFFSFAVFGKLLKRHRTLEGVDREKLRAAMIRGLQNQDGRARSQISEIYPLLSFEDIRPLLPAIQEAIVKPAPSGEMFADEVRVNGLKLFAQHHVEEGIQGCVDYLVGQNPWASEIRTPEILETLLKYGGHARRIIPRLREIAANFEKGEPDFPLSLSKRKAAAVRDAIARIEASQELPELKRVTP